MYETGGAQYGGNCLGFFFAGVRVFIHFARKAIKVIQDIVLANNL